MKTCPEEVATPLLSPLVLTSVLALLPPSYLGFLTWCGSRLSTVPCERPFYTAHLSVYMEVWGSSQALSFGLDQPLSLVSFHLEFPGEDGSEGDILSSLFGKLLGVPGKPGKDKTSKYNGLWKWVRELVEIRGGKSFRNKKEDSINSS